MCGLAGIHRRRGSRLTKMNELADALLLEIENRGTDATGYLAMLDSGLVQLEKKTIPASRFVKQRGRIKVSARTVLLHTRFATRGRKEDPRNAHPVASGRIAAVHNGTIYNADRLFHQYKLPRKAKVDSEIVPAMIQHLGWDKADKAIQHFEGGAALGIVSVEHPDELILARTNSYPMIYMVTDDVVVFASTRQAIERAWRRVYPSKRLGAFTSLPEWHMVRINGTIDVARLKAPRAAKRTTLAGVRGAMGGAGSGYMRAVQGTSKRPKALNGKGRSSRRAQKAYTGPSIQEYLDAHESPEETTAMKSTIEYLLDEGWGLKEAREYVYGDEADEYDPPWWALQRAVDARQSGQYLSAAEMLDVLDPIDERLYGV